MKQETVNTMQAIIAAQLAKANNRPTTPAPTTQAPVKQKVKQEATPAPAPVPVQEVAPLITSTPAETTPPAAPVEKSQLLAFTIEWHEGTGEHDGKTVTTWKKATELMNSIYNHHDGPGYSKCKVRITWQDGSSIIDRIDCGDSGSDYSPKKFKDVGDYLSRLSSVMYSSNIAEGGRAHLSFEDSEEEEPYTDPTTPPAKEEEPAQDAPELSSFTAEELLRDIIIQEETVKIKADIESEARRTAPAAPPTITAASQYEILEYSPVSVAVFGRVAEDTKKIKEELMSLGGKFNPLLNYNGEKKAGYIFSKKWLSYGDREQKLKSLLNLI